MIEDQIPLSALQHWAYCPRQWGLIHLDQAFDENVHTLRGRALHEKVDAPGREQQKAVRIERALPLWHEALGLIGKADVVEFLEDGTPYPVEYKQGSKHKSAEIAHCDDIQLAAQAICLEAMTGKSVSEGAIYYATSRRRRIVSISSDLRQQVHDTLAAIRASLEAGNLPHAAQGPRCRHCSLSDRCQPSTELQSSELSNTLCHLFDPDALI